MKVKMNKKREEEDLEEEEALLIHINIEQPPTLVLS